MLAKAAFPAFFFTAGGFVLFLLVTLSTPITHTFNLVQIKYPSGSPAIELGVFGQCSFPNNGAGVICSDPQVGYTVPNNVFGQVVDSRVTSVVMRGLSGSLVLNAVTAGLAGVSLIFSLFAWFCSSRPMQIVTFLTLFLSSFAGFVTFWLDLAVVLIARNRITDYSNSRLTGHIGNALWMALAGMGSLILALCAAGCGIFGRYSDRPYSSHNVAPNGVAEKPYTTRRSFWQRNQTTRGTY